MRDAIREANPDAEQDFTLSPMTTHVFTTGVDVKSIIDALAPFLSAGAAPPIILRIEWVIESIAAGHELPFVRLSLYYEISFIH